MQHGVGEQIAECFPGSYDTVRDSARGSADHEKAAGTSTQTTNSAFSGSLWLA